MKKINSFLDYINSKKGHNHLVKLTGMALLASVLAVGGMEKSKNTLSNNLDTVSSELDTAHQNLHYIGDEAISTNRSLDSISQDLYEIEWLLDAKHKKNSTNKIVAIDSSEEISECVKDSADG